MVTPYRKHRVRQENTDMVGSDGNKSMSYETRTEIITSMTIYESPCIQNKCIQSQSSNIYLIKIANPSVFCRI
jgi:hypothetical protein